MRVETVTAQTTIRLHLEPDERFRAPVERGRKNRVALVDTISVTLPDRIVTARGRKINPNGSLSHYRTHIVSLAFEDLTPAMLTLIEDEHRVAALTLVDLALTPTTTERQP